MIPLVCVSVTCPEREACAWRQKSFSEVKAAHEAGRSGDCFQPISANEICPNALHRALHCMSGAKERWAARRVSGLDDADLRDAIAKEFGEYTSGSQGPGWLVTTGPKFWFGNAGNGQGVRRSPDLQGKALLYAVRKFLAVPVPKAEQTPPPWAGLPLMQMMGARG